MTDKIELDRKVREMMNNVRKRTEQLEQTKKTVKQSWKTPCSFWFIGATAPINIQTAGLDTLEEIACHLCLFELARDKASQRINREIKVTYRNYPIDDWFDDINKRIAKLEISEQESKLEQLTKRLNDVLSPEERRRIEVESLMREFD